MASQSDNSLPARTWRCPDAEATRAAGRELAAGLDMNAVLGLDGPLGAGKTEFVKGLAEGLGSADAPTSPTFAIAHEYGGGRLAVFHFDFYRMEDEGEFDTCGFDECVGSGVVAAEWAEKFADRLPLSAMRIRFDVEADGGRTISLWEGSLLR